MGLLNKFKEWKERREIKAESGMLQRVTNARDTIDKLQTRKKVLLEREKLFMDKQRLEEEIKQKERSMKDMNYKEKNPLIYNIYQNVRQRLNDAKKERKPLNSEVNNPFVPRRNDNLFSSQSQSDSFRNSLVGNTNSSSQSFFITPTPPKQKSKTRRKRIKRRR